MGRRFQFQQAVEILGKLSVRRQNDDVYDLREAMEKIILDYCPSDANEASAVIDVLLLNVEAGPRIDGRDVRALSNLQHWCKELAEQSGLTSGSSVQGVSAVS